LDILFFEDPRGKTMMAEPNNEDLHLFLDGLRLSQLDYEYLPGFRAYEHLNLRWMQE